MQEGFIFENLTPHEVVILDKDNEVVMKFAPSGVVARVSEVAGQAMEFPVKGEEMSVSLYRPTFGEIEGLPEPKPFTFFIVSRAVLEAVKGTLRRDVVCPYDLVRDDAGRVIGCRGFAR